MFPRYLLLLTSVAAAFLQNPTNSGHDTHDDDMNVASMVTPSISTSPFNNNSFYNGSQDNIDDRFFSIFTVVNLANAPCTIGDNSGTCYPKHECYRLGGRSIGTCARGFGVCCYKEISCGGSSSMNCTYLVSPSYPGTYNEARVCQMSFTRTSNICQLRMDFVEFESAGPTEFGICTDDLFKVAGERKFAYLCGTSPTNWHFYLDVYKKANPTVFTFTTSSRSFARKFKIKISMIECSKKVPCGCGQYYTGNSGTIQSFNYGSFYLAGLDYGICFRKEKNLCTTTITRAGPTFIACPDLYRVPVGQSSGGSGILGLDTQNLYCHLFTLPFGPRILTSVPTPLRTVTNGPLVIWHLTHIDNIRNFDDCPSCAGFYQTYQHNPC